MGGGVHTVRGGVHTVIQCLMVDMEDTARTRYTSLIQYCQKVCNDIA